MKDSDTIILEKLYVEMYGEENIIQFKPFSIDEIWDLHDKHLKNNLDALVNGKTTQEWTVLPKGRVKRIWKLYGEKGIIRDIKGLTYIVEKIINNFAKLLANNTLTGRSQDGIPEDILDMYGFGSNEEVWEKGEETGYIDNILISDFGPPQIWPILKDLYSNPNNPEHVLLCCDRILNVLHQRSSLPGYFIEGGEYTLDEISLQ